MFHGKAHEDWPRDAPKEQDLWTVRRIVHQIEQRVLDLLGRIA